MMHERLIQISLNKAAMYKDAGQLVMASQILEELLVTCADDPELRYQLTVYLIEAGKYVEAVSHINQFPKHKVNESALCLAKLGQLFADRGAYQQAVTAFRASLELIEPNPAIWNNLGLCLIECGCSDDAHQAFSRAVALAPSSPEFHNNFGNLCVLRFEMGPAVEHFKRALELNPGYQNACINLGRAYRLCGDFENSAPLLRQAVAMDSTSPPAVDNLLSFLNYSEEDGAKVAAEHLRLAPSAYPGVSSYRGEPHPHAKPRIGFVSPDFRTHPVAYFFEPVLKHWDWSRFDLYCYAQVSCPDKTTERLIAYGGQWRSTVGRTDAQVIQQVMDDEIDLLVDLAGYTEGHRLGVFVQKPAPVQCSWLGYPNSTGLPQIDYRITDAVADPPGMTDQFHTEKLIRLPHSFLAFMPDDTAPTAPLPKGAVTFCCFNNLSKISDKTLLLWAAIMTRLPACRLLLKFAFLNEAFAQGVMRKRLEQHGIDLGRVDMRGFTPTKEEHLAMYGTTHIALDTYPYNGTTTTCEALWMGVPVVTLAGNAHVSRVGASILTAIGCQELVAEDETSYVEIAVRLAVDEAALTTYRKTLRECMRGSCLTDTRQFASDLEAAFGVMLGEVSSVSESFRDCNEN
jgi:predicted O-linked N-acetylglucosamine transferase (SPINDLY family)